MGAMKAIFEPKLFILDNNMKKQEYQDRFYDENAEENLGQIQVSIRNQNLGTIFWNILEKI